MKRKMEDGNNEEASSLRKNTKLDPLRRSKSKNEQ